MPNGVIGHSWWLPGAVSSPAGGRAGAPPRPRSVRDWVVDGLFFVLAVAGAGQYVESSTSGVWFSGTSAWGEEVLTAMGCLALWLRRRWPVGVALACAPLGVVMLSTPASAPVLALFTVAVHRPARVAVLVAVPVLLTSPLYFAVHPNSLYYPRGLNIVASITTIMGVLGWGMLVRSRRQVLTTLRDRAERAETEQQLWVQQARRAERARLAQETHDVLAHRISLVSLHAGALEYRTDATADEITQAAGVIRANAHQALQELREVIGLLRDRPDRTAPARADRPPPPPGPPAAPPPTLDVQHLDTGRHRAAWTIPPWLADAAFFAAAASLVALYGLAGDGIWNSEPLRRADLTFGALASLLLWLRRRQPVATALACAPLGLFVFATGLVAALVALFTVAARRGPRTALPISAIAIAPAPLSFLVRADQKDNLANIPIGIIFVLAALGWGMLVRSRHQLIGAFRERAVRAHREQRLRMAQARREERTRLAREMHDALAHRISLVSLHAGALEYGGDATADEITQTAAVIRTNAHRAMRELREVIGLLHEPTAVSGPPTRPDRPQPGLADIAELLAHSAVVGNSVDYTCTVTDPGAVPATIGRTIYRLTQEALTNARKHAPGTDVRLALTAVPGWLRLEITNSLPASAPAASRLPGTGTGLIGLAERVELANGYLTHGPTPDGTYHLEAWIPCPT